LLPRRSGAVNAAVADRRAQDPDPTMPHGRSILAHHP
jgi:hypothetical protein